MSIIDLLFTSKIMKKLEEIYEQGRKIMAKVDELLLALEEANTTTNEIAEDVAVLMAQLVTGGLTPEETETVKGQIDALTVRLKGVAAQYPPPVG